MITGFCPCACANLYALCIVIQLSCLHFLSSCLLYWWTKKVTCVESWPIRPFSLKIRFYDFVGLLQLWRVVPFGCLLKLYKLIFSYYLLVAINASNLVPKSYMQLASYGWEATSWESNLHFYLFTLTDSGTTTSSERGGACSIPKAHSCTSGNWFLLYVVSLWQLLM